MESRQNKYNEYYEKIRSFSAIVIVLMALTSCFDFQDGNFFIDLVKDYLQFWLFDVSQLVACEYKDGKKVRAFIQQAKEGAGV